MGNGHASGDRSLRHGNLHKHESRHGHEPRHGHDPGLEPDKNGDRSGQDLR